MRTLKKTFFRQEKLNVWTVLDVDFFPASKKRETTFAYVLLHVIAALEDESFLGLVVFLGIECIASALPFYINLVFS